MKKPILMLGIFAGGLLTLALLMTTTHEVASESSFDTSSEPMVHEEMPQVLASDDEKAVEMWPPIFDELPSSPRDEKVMEKLNRFMEKTADITAESVAQEREHFDEGLKNALSKKTPMPHMRRKVDANGDAWEELDYGDGVIRYAPAVLPEANL